MGNGKRNTMSDTPRTDASENASRKFYVEHIEIDWPPFDGSDFDIARQLERELHLEHLAATDNSDWFNALVNDLSDLLHCDRKPTEILEACKRLRSNDDLLRAELERLIEVVCSQDAASIEIILKKP